jgi:hypothetical protein
MLTPPEPRICLLSGLHSHSHSHRAHRPGTPITFCTSTKVQILTPEELRARASQQHEAASKCEGGRGEEAVAAEASRPPDGRHTAVAPCNNNGSGVLQMSMVMAMVTYASFVS